MNRHLKDQSGASLIMVIVFVMVFAVISAAILNFANTGFRTTEAVADVRDVQHAVDGAMEGAINAIRGDNAAGYEGFDCPTFEYTAPAGTDDPDVEVTCEAAGSETTGSPGDDQPKYAVLTLGDASGEGFHQTGNNTLLIDGGMFSNGEITVGNSAGAAISVLGNALAVKPCSPEDADGAPTKVVATGDRQCRLEEDPDHPLTAGEPDPDYPSAVPTIAGIPAVDPGAVGLDGDPVVTCTVGGVAKFTPGVYTEHPKHYLPSTCDSDVWWFSSAGSLGVYYFDLPEDESLIDVKASNVSIIGGTPLGWDESTLVATVKTKFPNACDPALPGVQFIFGGSTRLFVQKVASDGRLQLCSSASTTTEQQIALYGLKTGSRTPATTAEQKKINKTDPAGDFETATAARDNDGTSATATITGEVGATVLEIADEVYDDFGDIDLGSSVERIFLDVYHSESSTEVVPSIDVTIGGTTHNYALTNTTSDDVPQTIEITEDDLEDFFGLDTSFRYLDVNSLTATYKADGGALDGAVLCSAHHAPGHTGGPPGGGCTPVAAETANVTLDAVVLRVEHTEPGFRAHECPASEPDCAIVETDNNPLAVFRGTVYAPNAFVDVQVHNVGDVEFSRGVIARTIDVNGSASMKQEESPFSLPGLTEARVVLFKAFVDGDLRLHARVAFTDTRAGLALPGYKARIVDWVVVR